MQPLDRCFFSPLKKYYANDFERWMLNHPARAITIYQVATLFNVAYMRTANILSAVAGFKVGGIVLFNRDTDRPVEYANVLIDARNETGTSTQVPSCPILIPEKYRVFLLLVSIVLKK
ncbi:hypothetical protein HF086_009488 [Spodoptera exigua]|uniref:Uncharacterized protein n=1 Tax=Spodoptera exigua TaxID=7107 RepID=A0A922SFM1_SPOEX|nr:hypothetical protein HF086_009488 [Spodoptera exigua]